MTDMQRIATENRQIHIGAKMQTARESMHLDRKDAAAQLRLNESIIDMIETNSFPDDMPPIFIRGYIRSYGKLLQLSEQDIQAALEPIKPKATTTEAPQKPPVMQVESASNHKYLMQGLTAGIALLLLGLVFSWWHGRSIAPAPEPIAFNQTINDAIAPAGVSVQLAKTIAPLTTELPAAREAETASR